MEPVSAAACIGGLAGKGILCVAAGVDVAAVGGFVTFCGQEMVKAATRNTVHWHKYHDTYKKFINLGHRSTLVSLLANTVLQQYTPGLRCLTWVGAGTSNSSLALYEAVKVTTDSHSLFGLFQQYLSNDNNNGKRLEVLLRNCINNY